jgi:hypothetical protein
MSRAQQALQDLKAGEFDGAAVLVNDASRIHLLQWPTRLANSR